MLLGGWGEGGKTLTGHTKTWTHFTCPDGHVWFQFQMEYNNNSKDTKLMASKFAPQVNLLKSGSRTIQRANEKKNNNNTTTTKYREQKSTFMCWP